MASAIDNAIAEINAANTETIAPVKKVRNVKAKDGVKVVATPVDKNAPSASRGKPVWEDWAADFVDTGLKEKTCLMVGTRSSMLAVCHWGFEDAHGDAPKIFRDVQAYRQSLPDGKLAAKHAGNVKQGANLNPYVNGVAFGYFLDDNWMAAQISPMLVMRRGADNKYRLTQRKGTGKAAVIKTAKQPVKAAAKPDGKVAVKRKAVRKDAVNGAVTALPKLSAEELAVLNNGTVTK